MADSQVTIEGNLTRDPEVRIIGADTPKCLLGVAVNRSWFDKSTNERVEKVSFYDVECWRELGTNVAESLSKGDRVIVTGTLEQQRWETENGDNRSKVVITATGVGPSLKWATAKPVRTHGDSSSNGNSRQPATVGAGSEEFADEEPF